MKEQTKALIEIMKNAVDSYLDEHTIKRKSSILELMLWPSDAGIIRTKNLSNFLKKLLENLSALKESKEDNQAVQDIRVQASFLLLTILSNFKNRLTTYLFMGFLNITKEKYSNSRGNTIISYSSVRQKLTPSSPVANSFDYDSLNKEFEKKKSYHNPFIDTLKNLAYTEVSHFEKIKIETTTKLLATALDNPATTSDKISAIIDKIISVKADIEMITYT